MSESSSKKIDIGYLRSLKYNELRNLAKEMGLKCHNMKASKLIDVILEKAGITECEERNFKRVSEIDALKDKNSENSTPVVNKTNDLDKSEISFTSPRKLIRQNTFSLSPSTPTICNVNNDIKNCLSECLQTRRLPRDGDDDKKCHPNKMVKFTSKSTAKAQSKLPRLKRLNGHATPNFKLIHQRQFDKMESINDYVVKKEAKREAFRVAYEQGARSLRENKIRTRQMKCETPAFKQSLFKPTVFSTKNMNLNFENQKRPSLSTKKNKDLNDTTTFKFVASSLKKKENESAKKKSHSYKDLLKSKLRYKLPENSTSLKLPGATTSSILNASKNINGPSKRANERTTQRQMLSGVRLNRRFQLQLQCRGIVPK